MFRGRFFGALLALLLIIGLFGLAGSSIYRAGWTEGYFVGKVSSGSETGETTVITPDTGPGRYPVHGWGWTSPGGFFAGLLKLFFLFLLVGMAFKFLGLLFWRRHRHWGKRGDWRHGGWHHGGRPPWYGDEPDEPVMKA